MANNFKLYEYMEARGIEEENIQRMKDEKIDSVVINMMTDEALKQFVPRLGDRIALRSFCKKEKAPSNANSRKDTILTKLRHKLNKRKTKSSSSDEECGSGDTRSSSLLGNTNAQKNERKIDVGWLDYDFASGTYKQVRKHKGGGTRQLSVAKNIGYPELLTIAQDLFFKDGFSSRGELSEFRSEICDFRQRPLPDDINVGQLYTETKMAVLRFYLQTTSTNKGKTKRMKTNTVDLTEEMDSDASADLPFVDISNESQSSCPTTIVQPDTPTIVFGLTNSPATEEQLNDTVPDAEIFKDDNDMLNVPELDSRPTPCVPSTSSGSMNPSSSRSKNESAYLSYVDLCTSDSENDDEGLLQAIKNSLADAEHQTGTPMDIPLQDLILNYQSQHCIDEYHTIIVHRKRFLRSILYAYTQPGFNCQKQVHCEFAGEEAVDVGGPKREMFRLLMKAVCEELGVLEGEVGKQSFTHNIELLEKQKYTVAGSFVAWSLLHGGPGLPTLHPELFKLMCGLKSKGFDDVNIISDIDVRLKLSKIANCRTSEEYTVVAQELGDWAADQGVPSLYGGNFTQKDIVVASLLKHFMFYRSQSEIQQFTEGLGVLWTIINVFPDKFMPIFTTEGREPLTRKSLKKILKVNFSDEGSNVRKGEDDTVFCFEIFLQDCEDGKTKTSLNDVLAFISGADEIPPMGFDGSIGVEFFSRAPNARGYPTASTCALELHLPRGIEEPLEFRILLEEAIINGKGFGKI